MLTMIVARLQRFIAFDMYGKDGECVGRAFGWRHSEEHVREDCASQHCYAR